MFPAMNQPVGQAIVFCGLPGFVFSTLPAQPAFLTPQLRGTKQWQN
jgi:hypothetical protein